MSTTYSLRPDALQGDYIIEASDRGPIAALHSTRTGHGPAWRIEVIHDSLIGAGVDGDLWVDLLPAVYAVRDADPANVRPEA